MKLTKPFLVIFSLLAVTLLFGNVPSAEAMPPPRPHLDGQVIDRQEGIHDGTEYVDYTIEGEYTDVDGQTRRETITVRQIKDDIGWFWFDHEDDQVSDKAAEKLDKMYREKREGLILLTPKDYVKGVLVWNKTPKGKNYRSAPELAQPETEYAVTEPNQHQQDLEGSY